MNFRAIKINLLEKWNNADKRVLIASAALVFSVASILLILLQRETDTAEREIEMSNIEYAMVLQHYSGFDMTEPNTAVFLNWNDGITRLENGRAQLKLKARIYPVNLENKEIIWETSDPSMASIDENGNITVIEAGDIEFRATLVETGESADAVLTVIQPVSGIFLPTTNVQLYTNEAGRLLTAMVFPENATNKNVSWISNNEEVVTVDLNGRIKPVKTGSAVITAVSQDGGFSRTCHVTVSNPSIEVEEITLQNKEENQVSVGKSIQLTAVPRPTNAKNATPLKWESSDESIASVGQSGRVSGIKQGKATITVSSTNGRTDSMEITIVPSNERNTLDLSNVSVASSGGGVTYKSYGMTLPMMVRLEMGLNPAPRYAVNGGTRNATESEVAEYINPSQFYTGAYKYQFLDLSQSNGVSEEILNDFLADKGILSNQGRAFADAAAEFGLSEVYLVAHACLETGNGTSQLATGVSYGGETVYNMFGIGAYDSSAVSSGAQRAYELGWTSVEEAIRGGAEWISEHYIHSVDGAQNTLYKMLWNPDNPGTHQYATDISWAVKQAANIERIFNNFPNVSLSYEIPVYSGMVPPALE